jgi:hypothetical protein
MTLKQSYMFLKKTIIIKREQIHRSLTHPLGLFALTPKPLSGLFVYVGKEQVRRVDPSPLKQLTISGRKRKKNIKFKPVTSG